MARVKYPIRYELRPTRLTEGEQWLWVDLENVSDDLITDMTVRLISQDVSRMGVREPHGYVPLLPPGREQEIGFEVDAAASIAVYVSVTGDWDGAPFRWESPSIQLAVNEAVAQVTGLVAMGPPYPPAKEPVRMEAVVRAFGGVENLRLELWADTPGGALDRLAKINTGELNAGDERRYITAFTRGEKGTHAIYAYLYDGEERIDRRLEHIYVS